MEDSQPHSFKVYWRLLGYLKGAWFAFFLGLAGSFGAGFLDGWLGQYIRPFIDDGLLYQKTADLALLPLMVLAYFILRSVLGFMSVFCLYHAGNHVLVQIRMQAFSRLMGSHLINVKQSSLGGFLSLLNYNISQLDQITTGSLRRFVLDAVLIVTGITALLQISWVLSFLVLLLSPVMYWVLWFFSRRTRRESQNVQEQLAVAMRYAEQALRAVATIRSLSAHRDALARFDALLHRTYAHQKRFTMASSMMHALLQFIASIPLALIFILVIWEWIELTPGAISAFFYTAVRLMPPIRALSLISSDFQRGIAAASSVFEICDLEQEEVQEGQSFTFGTLACRNMSYFWQDRLVFSGVNAVFETGKLHVMIGRSGVGKSTLLAMLARLYPVCGEVTLAGLAYRELNLQDFRRHVGYLEQEAFLWDDSVLNNVIFPKRELGSDQERYQEIIQLLELSSWIDALPLQDQTFLGAGGVLPSGGQRQRIALARILFHHPELLILDEPLTAVDERTASRILEALQQRKSQHLVIMTAHQRWVAERADQVHWLRSDGMISGTHEELMQHQDYRWFWLQAEREDVA